MADCRTDLYVNLFKLGIFAVSLLASSGLLGKALASALAMLFGLSALGYSVLGFVVLGIDYFVSFGGSTGSGEVRDYLMNDPDLKAAIVTNGHLVAGQVIQSCAPQLVSRQKQLSSEDALIAIALSAIELLKMLLVNVAVRVNSEYQAVLAKVSMI